MQEMWVQSLGWDNHLEKERATHSSILAWEIPWTKEPGGLYYSPWGPKELDTTEWLSTAQHDNCSHTSFGFHFCTLFWLPVVEKTLLHTDKQFAKGLGFWISPPCIFWLLFVQINMVPWKRNIERFLFQYWLRNTYVHTKTCTWIFVAALFITAKTWKQPRCLLVGKWLN